MQLQNEDFFSTLQENALMGDLISKNFPGSMPPDPPRGLGLWPSVSQGTCLLTSQYPSTSKVNENPAVMLIELSIKCCCIVVWQTKMHSEVIHS